MARAITISVQLIDATLQGRRSLRLSKSTCNLGIVPRDMMKDTLANPKLNEQMLNKYSFYMLLSDNSSNSYGVYIKVGSFVMEMVYKPVDEPQKNEVRTKFYLDVKGIYKPFMLRKGDIPSEYANLQRKRRDHFYTSVWWDNWGNLIISTIKTVMHNPQGFIQMCQSSCPFNYDGL